MTSLLIGGLSAALLLAVDAPVTNVTVFTDQARVQRTAQVPLNGVQRLEFPPLLDSVDLASVRVEAKGAEVRRVDIDRVAPEKLRTDEAKAALAELERLDAELARVNGELAVLTGQRAALERLAPQAPESDALRPAPKLNAAGWAASAKFSSDMLDGVQKSLRDESEQVRVMLERRDALALRAQKLGQPSYVPGWRVTAELAGAGAATVTLTYLVRNARWTPTWDLQLQPDTNTVNLSLAGLVSQESGEDWTAATLSLSTAVPSSAVKVPRLLTWKIGTSERFIPTPTPMQEYVAPPPPVPQAQRFTTEEALLRAQLQRVAGARPAKTDTAVTVPAFQPGGGEVGGVVGGVLGGKVAGDSDADGIPDELDRMPEEEARPLEKRKAEAPPPPPPPVSRRPPASAPAPFDSSGAESRIVSDRRPEKPQAPVSGMSLAPPPAWQAPSYGADSPVTLAGGYDLAFTSLQKETVPSNKGQRRVALWSQQWPVSVERKIFPALAPEAFLVAELKNPSQQVLPGGTAQLYVGADPAGTARLTLVSPGEAFTLPLGIDRALKPVRNVQVVDSTVGLFSKDDVTTYVVTVELANPYRAPVAVKIYDQWPVTDQKEVEVKLLETRPYAAQDPVKGSLEWHLTIPPQQKTTLSFSYSLKRPHGWRLQQSEVTP